MDTWVWLTVIGVVAVALFALAWWSSGRSRARGRGPQSSVTDAQADEINTTIARHTPNRATFGGS